MGIAIRGIAGLTACLLNSQPAVAGAEWTQVAASAQRGGYTAWVDESRRVDDGELQTVWLRLVWATTSPGGLKETKMLRQFDCERRSSRLLAYVDYDSTLAVIDSANIPFASAPEEALVPDSVMAEIADHLCRAP